jgi:hypothetical protein
MILEFEPKKLPKQAINTDNFRGAQTMLNAMLSWFARRSKLPVMANVGCYNK